MAEKKVKKLQTYLLTILLLVLVAAGAVMLWPVYRANQKKQAELLQYRQKLTEKKAERNALAKEVEDLKTSPDAVEKVAREKFRYIRPGESVLAYPSPEKQSPRKQEMR